MGYLKDMDSSTIDMIILKPKLGIVFREVCIEAERVRDAIGRDVVVDVNGVLIACHCNSTVDTMLEFYLNVCKGNSNV